MSSDPTHRSSANPRTDAREDAELLAAYVDGNTDAFAVLVYRYQRVLLQVVRNLAWVEPDPEAVVRGEAGASMRRRLYRRLGQTRERRAGVRAGGNAEL